MKYTPSTISLFLSILIEMSSENDNRIILIIIEAKRLKVRVELNMLSTLLEFF